MNKLINNSDPKPTGINRWLYEHEIEIYINVRWFLMILGAATLLHLVVGYMEERKYDEMVVFVLGWTEKALFIGDAIIFLIAIAVGFILQVRKILLLVGLDIFSIWPWRK